MRLSTSNSSTRLPRGRWGRTWLATLILLGLLIVSAEFALRSFGFMPSVDPDGISWLAERARLRVDSTVLIGTSRMQSNLDPETWVNETGASQRPVNLALAGTSAKTIFEALADDPEFHGTILYDVVPRFAFRAAPQAEELASTHIDSYALQRISLAKRLELEIYERRAGRFVLTNPELRITRLIESLYTLELPSVPSTRMRPDRFAERNYFDGRSNSDVSTYEGYFSKITMPTEQQMVAQLGRLDTAVRRHEDKGGKVVFIAMPVCGTVAEITEAYFPRAQYWDRLVREVAGSKVRANDFPDLSEFECFDGSHLEFSDAIAFTRAIARRLEAL